MKLITTLLAVSLCALGADRVPRISIDSHETVLPHLVAGGPYWKTSITLVNVDYRSAPFTLRFYKDDGTPWNVAFVGQPVNSTLSGTIPVGGSITYTTQSGGDQAAGWAQIEYDWSNAAIAMWGVFSLAAIPANNTPASEGVVPASAENDTVYAVPFDNTNGMLMGLGLANPDRIPTTADLYFTGENGSLILKTSVTLPARGHLAYQSGDQWSTLKGKKGVLFVNVTSGNGLAMLGLRFNPAGTFTSMHTVYSYNYPKP